MQNFEYQCPTQVIFGKGSIAKLSKLVPADARILLAYGQGSAKKNGSYDQVVAAIKPTVEFSGIEPNPEYETLMKCVALAKENKVDFIVAVGGGSVVDGMKFVAAALNWTKTAEPWDILTEYGAKHNADFAPHAVTPIAAVLTLPATGTECNCGAVVSRRAIGAKLSFSHPTVFPKFSILDPDFINTLPPRQVINGVVDAFVHVMEQYAGHHDVSAIGDEFSEGILRVLITQGKEVALAAQEGREAPYAARADFWWATTQALNGLISRGAPECWASHALGHEITAAYGLDHAQTLAIVLPEILRFEKVHREKKLARLANRVFGVVGASDMAEEAILQIEAFFKSLGQKNKFSQYGLDGKHFETIADKYKNHKLGAEKNISRDDSIAILNKCL